MNSSFPEYAYITPDPAVSGRWVAYLQSKSGWHRRQSFATQLGAMRFAMMARSLARIHQPVSVYRNPQNRS